MRTPVLETERLLLRPLTVEDSEEIYRNWVTDPEVARFMTWSIHNDIQVTKEWLKQVELHMEEEGSYDWGFVRKSDQVLIGSGGIYYKEDRGMFTLGYNLMKSCWNQGYTSEAAARILQFATDELHQDKLFAYHAKENPNSGKVLERVGFQYVKDTEYDSMDGSRHFEAREYLFDKNNITCKPRYMKYEYNENIVDINMFHKDKLIFVVLEGIVNNKCRRVITDHRSFIICHSQDPYPIWIWAEDNITEDILFEIWECVKKEFLFHKDYKIISKYFVIDYFIKKSKAEGKHLLEIFLNMCTLECHEPITPTKSTNGTMGIADIDDLNDAAEYLYQFKQETGIDMETREQCLQKAKNLIEQEKLYFWKNKEGKNVAMCSFGVENGIGKLTHVYTKKEERRKGYAINLVYEVTCIIKEIGSLPVLYTDLDYKASNECYKKIGYIEVGKLCMASPNKKI